MNWTEYFLNIAEVIKSKSKDQTTHIGAVIAGKGNEILSTGYNSFPRGIHDFEDYRQERPEKYFWMVHAEINAIINAARIGVSTNESKMYLTCGIPCTNCGKAIINAGIKEIYCKKEDTTVNREKWDEEAKRTLEMFGEAGIVVNYY
jgi:dCMP deaminase